MGYLARAVGAASLLALAACSNDPASESVSSSVTQTIAARLKGAEAPVDARKVLTPAQIASSPTSLLLVVLETKDISLTAYPIASSFGTVQWTDATGGGLLTRDGVLVGTRGLGFDLMQAETEPLRAALRAGGGRDVLRVEHRLNGASEQVRERFFCDVVPVGQETLDFFGTRHATRVFEERCRGDARAFVNRYWLDGGDTVRQSATDLGAPTGIITIGRLVD